VLSSSNKKITISFKKIKIDWTRPHPKITKNKEFIVLPSSKMNSSKCQQEQSKRQLIKKSKKELKSKNNRNVYYGSHFKRANRSHKQWKFLS